MKKYTLPIILLAVSFSFSLSGCQKQGKKAQKKTGLRQEILRRYSRKPEHRKNHRHRKRRKRIWQNLSK